MTEKYPNSNGGKETRDNPPTPAHEGSPGPAVEPNTDATWHLQWAVSEALLRTVYDVIEHPGTDAQTAAATVALQVVQATRSFDLTSDADRETLAGQANSVTDRLLELIDTADEFTVSDLQGAVEALALRIVHHQLPIGGNEQTEGGEDE
ncbi:hypothetical protein ACWDSJ_14210 [Nocardia sp. NPDC003482]